VVSNADVEERSVLINGFMGGYVYAENTPVGGMNIKRPLKDEIHDHTMRCVEYIIQQFGKERMAEDQLERSIKGGERQIAAVERQQQAAITRKDYDPADKARGRVAYQRRGGW
jgi:hypothetical protein